MANKNMQGKQSAPRYASIMGQPHMLAYINREEEQMLYDAGGSGNPGPAGIPAFNPNDQGQNINSTQGTSYSGTESANAMMDSLMNATSNDDDNNSPESTNTTNTNVITNPDTEWKTTTMHGQTVQYTGTPGQGDFFLKDPGYMDPYEYMDLIGADYDEDGNWTYDNADGSTVYSDNAAFDMSHYNKDEDHAADVAFYAANPNATITTEQYGKAIVVAKALNVATGVLGLGYKAIVELQRRGILPGNTATSYFTENNVPETTQTDTDNTILEMAAAGATNEEITEALDDLAVDNSMENKVTALDAMSDAAFEGSNSEDVANNPENYFSDTYFSDNLNATIDPDTKGTNIDRETYAMGDQDDIGVSTIAEEDVALADEVTAGTAKGYNVEKVDGSLSDPKYQATAQTGTVTDDMQVDAEANVLDIEATSKGLNAVGRALNDFAKVDISRVIDTSTVQGKLLAEKLGEGNYVDSKSTILGQMEIISDEFKDSNGNPKIPSWAQAAARNVQKTIAFKGMTGSAATAALANAMMESTLGVAEKEASFFQTLTVENLDNRQEALINKASILSNMEMANLDARMTAAVQNAKSFLQMELTNLDNKQQTELLNTETRVDGLLEDARAVNAERLFSADADNDFTKFYDELSTRIDIHRSDTLNAMAKFNTGELNDNAEFQANLDLSREKFYTDIQYNIDLSNAKWRQSITLAEAEMEFDAAKLDAENMFALTSEGLNRTWDREDAYFDYIWKSSETELERSVDIYKVDKVYETEMRKIGNAEAIAKGKADYEVFKLIGDVADIAEDVWDVFN